MTTKVCELCNGTKHVKDPKGLLFVPCGCLLHERALARYRRAGVPERHMDIGVTWRAWLKGFVVPAVPKVEVMKAAVSLSKRGLACEPRVLFHGAPVGRDVGASLMVRSACDGLRSALLCDLPRLIDHEFKRDAEEGAAVEDPYRVGLLALVLGSEPAHKWNRPCLEKALRGRYQAKLPTVVVATVDPHRLGPLYHSSAIESDLRQFVWAGVQTNTRAVYPGGQ